MRPMRNTRVWGSQVRILSFRTINSETYSKIATTVRGVGRSWAGGESLIIGGAAKKLATTNLNCD